MSQSPSAALNAFGLFAASSAWGHDTMLPIVRAVASCLTTQVQLNASKAVFLCLLFALVAAQAACTRNKPEETEMNPDVTAEFLSREESFSVIIFNGDVEAEIAALLDALEYRRVSSFRAKLPLGELSKKLLDSSTPTEVQKAIFKHSGFTILVDPEMVVAELGKEHIKRLCSGDSIRAVSVIWERVSQTVIAQEWTSAGELRESFLLGEAPPKDAPAPAHPTSSRQPNPAGVKALLQARGIPPQLFTEDVEATVLVLAES